MFQRVRGRRPLLGPIVFLVAIAVCVSALATSWWAVDAIVYYHGEEAYCENYWTTVFPSGTYASECGGSSPPGSGGSSGLHVPHVAAVMAVSVQLTLLGAVLSALVVLFSVLPRPGFLPRRGLAVLALSVGLVAATACFVGAAYFEEELPHAWQSDNFTYQTGDPHPPSFSGQNTISVPPNNSGITETWTWGPTSGWYLSWAAGGLMGVGSILTWGSLWRNGWRRRPRGSSSPPSQ